jgi:putative ABC transport system substrate-binding protein
MNNRRKLIVALGAGALTAPLPSFAQQPSIKVARVGYITGSLQSADAIFPELRRGLRDVGLIEGQNLIIEYRSAEERLERIPGLAAELVSLKPDVIVTTSLAAEAVRNATKTIPIVFVILDDPVAAKLVSSLARPGGNATGLSSLNVELDDKRIELLKETLPRLKQVVALSYPDFRGARAIVEAAQKTCRAQGLGIKIIPISNVTRLDDISFSEARTGDTGLVILGFGYFFFHQEKVAALAAKKRLPGIAPWKTFTETGGLMSYGTNSAEIFKRAAVYVDKILKGVKPADLPVEQPTKFELVVNLKTAKALGIKIPNSILVQATKVIE